MDDRHHCMARSLINSTLESSAYSSANYANLNNDTWNVVIDSQANNLGGTLNATVVSGSVTGTNSTTVTYKQITMKVTWNEPEGQQSDSVVRWVTLPLSAAQG